MNAQLPYIYDAWPNDLKQWLSEHHQPNFRFKQITTWLSKGIVSAQEMNNLPQKLQTELEAAFSFDHLTFVNQYASKTDGTVKYVAQTSDGHFLECVYMEYKAGTSICVSSQSGCQMGCRFCASTGIGFGRNLSAGEMFAQVVQVAKDRGRRIDHITVMGIGEPLQNLEAVLTFVQIANHPDLLNIGMRKITLSTCGLVPEMNALSDFKLPLTLAISLHASNDEIRQKLMPIAHRYDYQQLMTACKSYQKKTGRRMTYEYAMFKGINDKIKHANELADRLEGQLCHVNLIPANETPSSPYKRSSMDQIRAFQSTLLNRGIACTIRRELGGDIQAACGQLRRIQDGKKRSY